MTFYANCSSTYKLKCYNSISELEQYINVIMINVLETYDLQYVK